MEERIRVVCLGTSQLLYRCARVLKEYYGQRLELLVINVRMTPILRRKYAEEFGSGEAWTDKERVFAYLGAISVPTYVLSINNPYLIPTHLCEKTELTWINLHHALLPRHPGRNAECWTIYAGDAEGGITWHYIAAGIDDGDVIAQRRVAIGPTMTAAELLRACEAEAIASLREELIPLEALRREAAKRQTGTRETVHKAADVPADGRFDATEDIREIAALLRATDYGAAKVFPRPVMCWEGQAYEVMRYTLTRIDEQTQGKQPPIRDGRRYAAVIAAQGIRLQLTLRKCEEDPDF